MTTGVHALLLTGADHEGDDIADTGRKLVERKGIELVATIQRWRRRSMERVASGRTGEAVAEMRLDTMMFGVRCDEVESGSIPRQAVGSFPPLRRELGLLG